MNCLIVGYGSIGSRHAKLLNCLGHNVHIVSKQTVRGYKYFESIKQAFEICNYHYVVISNWTNDHYGALSMVNKLGYSGKILIEKPIFDQNYDLSAFSLKQTYVGYNLRFHPAIMELKEKIQKQRIISMHVYCGSYLPDWRPGVDYTTCASSSKKDGGGVLRELSHELDYINWLTGGWKQVAAIGGQFSSLELDSDDVFAFLIETKKCPVVSLQVNYFDRTTRRELIVNCDNFSIKVDLVNHSLFDGKDTKYYSLERDTTYIKQHEAILKNENEIICNLEEGLEVLSLLEAAERASERKKWERNHML